MNLRNRILAIVGTLMLVGGTAATTLAAPNDTGDASVTITTDPQVNVLSVTIGDSTFAPKPYSFSNQTSLGELDVDVSDTRGTEAGWNVLLSGSNFTNGAESFAISNLSLAVGTVSASSGSTDGIASSLASPVLLTGTGTTEILEADIGEGAGVYDVSIAGTLNIPGGTLVGTYKSIVRVEIASGP